MSKIVGATNKWLRKRLELEKEGQINPTLHLLHVSVTLRSLDPKNGRQRRKETAENWLRTFIYAAPGLICKLMRGVSCELETLFIVIYCGTMHNSDATVMQLWYNAICLAMLQA